MSLFQFLFVMMIGRYFRAIRIREVRLWFAPLGPILLIAGFVGGIVLLMPTSLVVSCLFAGGAIMRAQAAMIERVPGFPLRNGAIVVAALMVLSLIFIDEKPWAVLGLLGAAGLFALHQQTQKRLDQLGLVRDETYVSYADQLKRKRDA